MGALSKQQIQTLIDPPFSLIAGYQNLNEQLQANGIDLTLQCIHMFLGPGHLGEANSSRILPETQEIPFSKGGIATLEPGSCYLLTLNETINLPDSIMGISKPRSSLLRSGVAIHNAVWDAGYVGKGQVLLVVHNPSGFSISKNARIIQLVLFSLDEPTNSPYSGKFQGQTIVPSH